MLLDCRQNSLKSKVAGPPDWSDAILTDDATVERCKKKVDETLNIRIRISVDLSQLSSLLSFILTHSLTLLSSLLSLAFSATHTR